MVCWFRSPDWWFRSPVWWFRSPGGQVQQAEAQGGHRLEAFRLHVKQRGPATNSLGFSACRPLLLQGCTAVHKLKDNLKIFHELAGPVFPPRDLRSAYLVQVRCRGGVGVCLLVVLRWKRCKPAAGCSALPTRAGLVNARTLV